MSIARVGSIVVLAVLASMLSGCLVAVGGSHASSVSRHMRGDGPHGIRCSDIELARNIGFSGERGAALARIAALPDLTEHEQVFLVDATTADEGFSSDKADVLVALAGNPGLAPAARERMAMRVADADMFSSDIQRVSQALLPE